MQIQYPPPPTTTSQGELFAHRLWVVCTVHPVCNQCAQTDCHLSAGFLRVAHQLLRHLNQIWLIFPDSSCWVGVVFTSRRIEKSLLWRNYCWTYVRQNSFHHFLVWQENHSEHFQIPLLKEWKTVRVILCRDENPWKRSVPFQIFSEGPAKHQYRQEAKTDAFYMGVYHKGLFFLTIVLTSYIVL